ncbi:MAG: hypothetical protein IJ106_05570 [Parasporobacterium sp.]|nr:hypothetical protein [Parasporobacterium sp.]
MKKNLFFTVFIALCLILCVIPSLFMTAFRSDETIGNESRTDWPSVTKEDGTFNSRILEQMGSYFETHYAFRPQLITADAEIQSALFQVSNTDSVTVGSDGWLYYSSTLNDYLGKNPLSERGVFNLAHNLSLVQSYVTAMGAKFLFMVPPNKNSLYPEHMPYYYSVSESDIRNRDHLGEKLEAAGVSYLDLFDLIGAQEETLYLKHDSHWNNKGAMMVYNRALDLLEKEHETYSQVPVRYDRIHKGDLSNMIYPSDNSLEEDYAYDYETLYEYVPGPASSDPVSVEDFRIETSNPSAEDTLLMYRDSFGNTLIPILSNAFAHGYYAKSTPYPIARDMQQYTPDFVIIELVERNLRNLAADPAVVPSPRRNIDPALLEVQPDLESSVQTLRADANYIAFSGTVPEERIDGERRIYLAVQTPEGSMNLYEAYTVTNEETDYGYAVYLPLSSFGTLEEAQQRKTVVYVEK